ncbi:MULTISPECIES: hypothetical protein [unclassified Mesorhizobium]|uniref:hypothetical protein n=1 Tax=unclassified Mesorhizobium TaxID=325217 RepID=UPI000BB09299|nr:MULTISPECIES: hypothetical protein [unclassified Mesorhizobium]PBC22148.1 hypothetical protein CK226_16050 [Mesorhizobium sp. WSM4311]TRD09653.1 hypothetical protein FJV82_02915 [Mesorhizobium sp. WSM4305]
MRPDEKALAALRLPGWDPNGLHDQYVTHEAVTAFMAQYLDQRPDGRPLYEKSSPVEPWTGPRNAAGEQTYFPSLWTILDTVVDPSDLTSEQVAHLVMTSTENEGYTPADWEEMVEGIRLAAKVRQDKDKRSKRHKLDHDDRAERGGRERVTLDHIQGQRVIPDEALSQRAKMRRTKSLKAAQERRKLRRMTTEAIMIQPRKDEWREMTPSDVKQYHQTIDKLVAMGTLDPLMVDEETNPEGSPLAYLYRMGRMTSKGDRA